MKFALNYSPQAAALLDMGDIQIDLYKCPDWPDLVQTARHTHPAYVHFPLMAGGHNIEQVGWKQIDMLLSVTDTAYINTHLAPRGSDYGIPLDSRDPAHADRLLKAMLGDIEPLVKRYGPDKVILENAMWDVAYDIPLAVLQPDIISRAVNETGCGFLLDTAHARVTAKYLGIDARAYMAQLPVDHLREWHVTGLRQEADGQWSDHFAMMTEDWALTEWSAAQIRSGQWATPWAMAFEYGGVGPLFDWRSETQVIATQAPRLYELARSVVAATN